ncbi:hypothetical protein E2C01_017567 [Portunus trituberculatus]|uniref:Uncharacterized protein n=1 Tax=Portunus trituberculatus TaxID=210409 RepID=A0A5B7DU58_PORTR|nr:hypothetical protein [Portunus trituberculatus]
MERLAPLYPVNGVTLEMRMESHCETALERHGVVLCLSRLSSPDAQEKSSGLLAAYKKENDRTRTVL